MKTTDKPTLQSFHLEGVRHIHPSDALEAFTNGQAIMIDVREMNEVKLKSVPLERVLNHPMSVIADRLPYIAKDQQIIVACPGGVRSVKVAQFLGKEGYLQVASLDGGFKEWKTMGLPFVPTPPPGGCGCDARIQNLAETPSLRAPLKNNLTGLDLKNLKRT